MEIIDANVILRYLLDDDTELSEKAREIIDNNVIDVPIEVLCEVVYVLFSVYKVSRSDICDRLQGFINDTLCILPHKEVVMEGLEFYKSKNIDFVDCLLAAYHYMENFKIHTFDKKLKRLLLDKN
jgi:predicted nucleic-acid-binding protein